MKITNKKTLIIASVFTLTVIAGGAYAYSRNTNKKDVPTPTSSNDNEINYLPPTDEEKKSGDNAKEKFDRGDEAAGDSRAVKTVKPEITYSGVYQGNVEISSHVPGIFENSGKCILKLSKDEVTVTQTKTAVPNVSEMSCGLIKITTSKLSPGKWKATVSYSSVKAKGSSDSVSIGVK